MDIDWEKGPEGAIGFAGKRGVGETSIWYRRTASGDLEYCVDGSSHWMASYQVPDDVVWREEESAAWGGEGYPPAGTVCEVRFTGDDTPKWERVTVIYQGYKFIAVRYDDGEVTEALLPNKRFEARTIRTSEQIAAEEREIAICAMMEICSELPCRQSCAELYDAGYRKQVAP